MLLKVALAANILATVMISRPSGTQSNTSIAELSKHIVKWYREVIT